MFIPLYCVLTWSTLIIKKYSCQFIFRIVVGLFFLYLNKSIMFCRFWLIGDRGSKVERWWLRVSKSHRWRQRCWFCASNFHCLRRQRCWFSASNFHRLRRQRFLFLASNFHRLRRQRFLFWVSNSNHHLITFWRKPWFGFGFSFIGGR
jgi:hypothetical protein